MTALPTELICAIIECVAGEQRPEPQQFDNSCNPKVRWDAVAGLAASSRLLRAITLEAWFHTLYLTREADLDFPTASWPAVFDWVRELHVVVEGDTDAWSLARFARAHSLRIDLLDTASYAFPFAPPPPALRTVNVRNLNWPSPRVYTTLARTFPGVRALHVHQPRVWCGLCNLCEIPSFRPAGTETLRYTGGVGLPAHYATMLAPMACLERVVLTVGNTGRARAPINPRANADLWSGECAACVRTMYADAAFRAAWVQKKARPHPSLPGEQGPHPTLPGEQMERNGKRPEELDVAKRPPMLREVVWEFWKVEPELDAVDELNY
ncbi:hypothetical protein HWV62_26566 [Athelia sp. TMB]|nr:hypothetical protein HWV62_26566 [Athelia sp. TMB]